MFGLSKPVNEDQKSAEGIKNMELEERVERNTIKLGLDTIQDDYIQELLHALMSESISISDSMQKSGIYDKTIPSAAFYVGPLIYPY